jgi:hypothetical protein
MSADARGVRSKPAASGIRPALVLGPLAELDPPARRALVLGALASAGDDVHVAAKALGVSPRLLLLMLDDDTSCDEIARAAGEEDDERRR